MLYFIGYNNNEGSWTGNFNNALRGEFTKRNIAYTELPPFDWDTQYSKLDYYTNIESSNDDIWFIGWAQSPVIELLQNKKGRKYGIVVGTVANPFEPTVLWGGSENINERFRLGIYDKIFAVSDWCKELLTSAYPEIQYKVVSTGFPIDYQIYDNYRYIGKQPNLIVFNQRFSVEKLNTLEVELSRRLISMGYVVKHFSGHPLESISLFNINATALMDIMRNIGVEFVYNPTKEIYHQNLAKASFVVTTSISDMLPNSMLEAIYMGAIPVAPRNLSFPEFIHPDNLYTPYDIQEMIDIIIKRPIREHGIMKYSKELIIERFLREMNV